MNTQAIPGPKFAILLLLSLVPVALLGGCGAAPESVEDGAEQDVSMETQAARAADMENQPVDESASESVQLQDLDDLGDLPVANDPLTETESKTTCLSDCTMPPGNRHPESCKEICYCIYPNGERPEGWSTWSCIIDVICRMPN